MPIIGTLPHLLEPKVLRLSPRTAYVWEDGWSIRLSRKGDAMSKRGRKRKTRAKSGANHGKRPNA